MFRKLWVTEQFEVNQANPIYKNVLQTNPDYSVSDRVEQATAVPNLATNRIQQLGTGVAEFQKQITISDQTQAAINFCKAATIDTLIGQQDPNINLRCGWIYKKRAGSAVPEISQGAFGTFKGPIAEELPAGSRWFWNLEKARDEIQKDMCMTMTSCGDLQNTQYTGKCVWDKVAGKGVAALAAKAKGGENYVTSAGSCPPAPKVPGVCDADPVKGLSVNCLSQMNQQAGCSAAGTIAAALAGSLDAASFARSISQKPAYQRWRDTTPGIVDPSFYSQGTATSQVALQEFQRLQIAATSPQKSSQNAAARDLCLGTEKYESYDFCSELNDSTRAPFPLECIQKLWQRSGGLPTGSMYPKMENKSYWDSLGTWGAVKNIIARLKAAVDSAEPEVQTAALDNYLGIKRAPPPNNALPFIGGVEIFWYDTANNTLIERRIVDGNRGVPSFYLGSWKNIDNTGRAYNLSFNSFVNIRPPKDMSVQYSFTTDDGSVIVQGRDRNIKRGDIVNSANYFARYYDQAPTTHVNTECSSWKKDGDNILAIFWQQSYGDSAYNIQYSDCGKKNFQKLNPDWLSLTQEPFAPFYSYELWMRPNQNGEIAPMFSEKRQFNNTKNAVKLNGSNYAMAEQTIFSSRKKSLSLFGNTTITCTQPIAYSAVGTITFTILFDDLPTKEWSLLEFENGSDRSQKISLVKNGDIHRFQCSSRVGSQENAAFFGKPVVKGQWYFVIMRFNKDNNTVTAAAVPYPKKVIGTGELFADSVSVQSMIPLTTRYVEDARNAGRIQIGRPNQGFNASIIWVHLFDYELKEGMEDILSKELQQNWLSTWYI